MSKIIVQNNADIPDEIAIQYIVKIIKLGRISNKSTQYCYHTSFKEGIEVSSFLNKNSDRFVIYKDTKSKNQNFTPHPYG